MAILLKLPLLSCRRLTSQAADIFSQEVPLSSLRYTLRQFELVVTGQQLHTPGQGSRVRSFLIDLPADSNSLGLMNVILLVQKRVLFPKGLQIELSRVLQKPPSLVVVDDHPSHV